ncbi:MAG: NB-ARC domain-containing protein [Thainema sp.]
MADSLRMSDSGLQIMERARRLKHWHKTSEAWCMEAFTSRATLNRFWRQQPIRSETFISICKAVSVDWQTVAEPNVTSDPVSPIPLNTVSVAPVPIGTTGFQTDWADAPEILNFVGRAEELQTLSQWLEDETCRLILLLGTGGVGKTALAVHNARLSQPAFDGIIWQSLRNAPTAASVIHNCIATLAPQSVSQLPPHLDSLINWLLKTLRQHRCLWILDNLESVLQPGSRTGAYRPGFEGYGQLLRSLSDAPHQSQILVTSRELPKGIGFRIGRESSVRSLNLAGLPATDIQLLLQAKGDFVGSTSDWQALTERYAGNPLMLTMVVSMIRDCFDSSLAKFLQYIQQEPFILDDICQLIDDQVQRLPKLEQSILTWLAIHRISVSLTDLQQQGFIEPPLTRDLLQAIASLQVRSHIQKQGDQFTLPPIVMEAIAARYAYSLNDENSCCRDLMDMRSHLASERKADSLSQCNDKMA